MLNCTMALPKENRLTCTGIGRVIFIPGLTLTGVATCRIYTGGGVFVTLVSFQQALIVIYNVKHVMVDFILSYFEILKKNNFVVIKTSIPLEKFNYRKR